MNRATKNSFMNIQAAAASFQNSIVEALKKYEADKAEAAEEAKQYKNETERLSAVTAALKANARNRITRAEQTFTSCIKTELDALRSELASHLLTAPSAQFISTLMLYRDFGIIPGRAEINALISMSGGNTLALRCINGLLETVGAEYRVDFPASEELEKDLFTIETLSRGHFLYSPVELHAAASEVYGNQLVTFFRPDGSKYEDGTRVDSIRLISSRAAFESNIAAVDAMAERWSDSVIPSIVQIERYKDTVDENGNTIPAKDQFEADRAATVKSVSIEKAPALPHDMANSAKNYAEVMDRYTR